MRPLANWTGVYPSKWPVGVGMIIRGGDFLRGSFGNRSRLSPGKPRSIHNQALPELSTLAFVPPMCFDAKCKEDADRAFELAIGVPILAAILIGAYLARPPPSEPGIFEDKQTGVVFKSPEPGVIVPETDKNGELVYRAVSYTLYPLSEDAPGERIRIDVGPLTDTGPRTFVFERIFPYSQFVVCTLPRPLGIVFEEIKNLKRVTVGDFVPGSNAESLAKRGKLNPALAATTPRPGDVLRACSSVNIVYDRCRHSLAWTDGGKEHAKMINLSF